MAIPPPKTKPERPPWAKPAPVLKGRAESTPDGDRIAKLLARAGIASRREVERMIAEGRIKLNDVVVATPATILKSLAGITVDGKPVEESYGFTAKTITPALLWGPVPGRIDLTTKGYMAASNKLWSVIVPDEAYPRLKALVQRYAVKPGSIYRMNERNCVHFVAEAASVIGMRLPDGHGMMKRPTSYMMAIAAANKDFPTLKMALHK